MTVLTTADLQPKHSYLGRARPDWSRSMAGVRSEGGPWRCSACGTASVLCYRCSACGRDLAASGTTHGREG